MTGPDWSKLIYVVIMVVIIVAVGSFSLGSLLSLHRLRNGIPAKGQIVGKRIDDDDGIYYHVSYSFPDAAGTVRTKEIQLRRAYFDSLAVGESVRVVYQAERPENSYLGNPMFIESHARSMRRWFIVALGLTFIVASFVHQCAYLDRC